MCLLWVVVVGILLNGIVNSLYMFSRILLIVGGIGLVLLCFCVMKSNSMSMVKFFIDCLVMK